MVETKIESICFKLDEAQFEGPLDLILHLISKHKLDIYDIEIFELVKQYIAYIKNAKEQNLELASEFLEMASRLVYIKSVMLLPKYEEEKDILKKELEGQLIEYSICKQVAQLLEQMDMSKSVFVRESEEKMIDYTYEKTHNPAEILKAYLQMIGKKSKIVNITEHTFEPIVARKAVSVRSRALFIIKSLYKNPQIKFDDIFLQSENIGEIVATFLAVLELIKSKTITITNDYYIKLGKNDGEYIETDFIEE